MELYLYVHTHTHTHISLYKSRLYGNVMAGGMVKCPLVDHVGLLDCTGFAHKPGPILLELIILW